MKRALITGGASPIGAVIATELGGQGIHIIVHANTSRDAAETVAEQIRGNGGSAEVLIADLTDAAADEALAALAEDPVQILVHNAGLHRDMPFAAMEREDWTRVVDVNLNSFFTALRPLILPMMRTRWGRIVAISSLTAVRGNRGQTNYAAAKGGLLPLAKSLTREYGSRGITANVIAPGVIDTPETRALDNFEDLIRFSPAGRAGLPAEVAALAAFLVSEKAAYLSGQLICLDGGSS